MKNECEKLEQEAEDRKNKRAAALADRERKFSRGGKNSRFRRRGRRRWKT